MFKKVIFLATFVLLAACAQPEGDSATAAAEQAATDAASSAAGAADTVEAAAAEAADAAVDIDALVAAADPEEGKRFYIFCQACHSLNEGGMNKVGPNLYGVAGSPAAQVEGFVYSDALTNAGLTWDAATLDAWIERPAELVPGTTMVFAGIPDQEQRAALIAFLLQAGGQ